MSQSLITIMILTTVSAMMMKSTSPMKTCLKLMIASTTTCYLMWTKSANSWIPLAICMLFTGGVLIMMMMISSIMPNEKMKKIKFKMMATTMSAMIMMIIMEDFPESNKMNEMSMKLQMNWTTIILMLYCMMLYLTSSMMLTQKEESSLRSFL